ncbi:hypothetical protein E2562_020932 [Oryza meyeriana var. granulata]|uniref:Uncharacterized protein n=1 Tax=Oryza meyeriana var. granulata TaxID=110450 RepID=A0A6G1DYX1_9ORYZ|nr:hypothetical protein E2562_020932 [Oryza meyeriana var. granulata]
MPAAKEEGLARPADGGGGGDGARPTDGGDSGGGSAGWISRADESKGATGARSRKQPATAGRDVPTRGVAPPARPMAGFLASTGARERLEFARASRRPRDGMWPRPREPWTSG